MFKKVTKQLLWISLMLAVSSASSTLLASEYLVKYKPTGYSQVISMNGFTLKDVNRDADLMKIDVPKANEISVISQLYLQGGVEYIVPNARVYAFEAPIEKQELQEQWHLAKVKAKEAWAKAGNRGSRKIVVAVIDTGVDYNHGSLKDNMISGYDFAKNDDDPMDQTSGQNPGHGTHCAGIIGATGVVDGGTIGISPEVSIMPIRFLDERGGGDLNNGIKAIDFAISKKVDVISASWGAAISRSQAKPLIEAVERATKAGILFVAAAANDGKNNDNYEVYPSNSNLPNFMSIAASGPNDEKPSWSNYGTKMVTIASPGLDIISTLPGGKYGKLSGTSMATPLVAGLAAFLKAQDNTLSAAQIISILQSTGANVQIPTQCDCRIDALAATELILDKKMYLVPVAGTLSENQSFKMEAYNNQGDVQYQSSNESVLKVTNDGTVNVVAQKGDAIITAVDSSGVKVSTRTFHVGAKSTPPDNGGSNPGNPGNPGMPSDCPFKTPMECQMSCAIMPELPWCQKK